MRPITWVLMSLGIFSAAAALGQQVQITTPYHSINDSFYENFGVGWRGIDRMGPNGGWFFNGPRANSALPPFGGHDPSADSSFGFRMGPVGFNMLASQGSNRSHVMQAPTIVIPNGGSGYLFDGSVTPFVMGVVPVVGGGGAAISSSMSVPMPIAAPVTTSPLAERLERMRYMERMQASQAADMPPARPAANAGQRGAEPAAAADDAPLVLKQGRLIDPAAEAPAAQATRPGSTAERGDLSVQEIRQAHAAADAARSHEVLVLIELARGKEIEGKPDQAKIYYQQAATRAEGKLKQQLSEKIQSLSD